MYVCGQHFPRSILDRIRETVRAEPFILRLQLSRRVCEWLNWRSPNGRLQEMSCRKALVKLSHCGVLDLPRQEKAYGFERSVVNPVEPPIAEVCCPLRELGEVGVYPVSGRYSKESKICFALLDRYHYLGNGPLCGAQIRYVVKSSTPGYLGALAFRVYVGDSAGHRDGRAKKIFLYPLCPGWREVLCAEPPIRLAERPRPEAPEHWAEEELGTVRLYDDRLKQRLYRIAQDFYNCPQANIPEACGSKALCCYANKRPVPPEKPPSMREAVLMVGAIGGHLGRKGDGFPGAQTLWRGLERLYAATEMYAIVTRQYYPHPMQSGP